MEPHEQPRSSVALDQQELAQLTAEDNDAWKHVVLELLGVVSAGVLMMAITVAWVLAHQ